MSARTRTITEARGHVREPAITLRERVLLDLARRDKTDVDATFRDLTEVAAALLGVSRVSIWQLIDSDHAMGEHIVCKDLYLRDEQRHAEQDTLRAHDFPSYFRAIRERRIIVANDARTDPRTLEYSTTYLEPHGIYSMMDVPIWSGSQIYGILCFEQCGRRTWDADAEGLAVHFADIASLSLEEGERADVEKRTQAIVDSVAEGVVVMDASGTIVHANPVARRDFIERAGGGLSLAERASHFEFLDIEDQPLPPERFPFVRVLNGETVKAEVMGVVFKRTGERWYYRLSCSPIYVGGTIKFVVYVASDISSEIYFERLKRDFIAALAHELKTPVAIVKGYAQHLQEAGRVPDASQPMLGAIDRAADRMDRLISSLLDISSVTLGRLALAREPVDLVELARGSVERVARITSSHHLIVRAPEHAPLYADRARIEQAIEGMLENAVRYSPQGGDVEVGIRTDDGTAVLSVRDHGIGIPVAVQRRIFEMFFKASVGPEPAGSSFGIGLFLAREIARRHGGDIWFESVEGQGSTFHMRLPLSETT
jgi:two-component system, OmpR family, phosphate regulon sensor histidine kinase PhoR